MTLKEYHHDNGFKSRKWILAVIAVIAIALLGLSFAIFNLSLSVFSTTASSIVTIVLGYMGISSARAAIPLATQNIRQRKQEAVQKEAAVTKTSTIEEEEI